MRAESQNWHFCRHGGEAPMAEYRESDLIDRDGERNRLKINIEYFICLESFIVRGFYVTPYTSGVGPSTIQH